MKVLILCTGNSCRSQMAHGFLQSFDKNIIVHSAGTQAGGKLNEDAVKAMAQVGIDISHYTSDPVEMYLGQEWDYVITVCNDANETCPAFIGKVKYRLHIGFDDPSKVEGTLEFIESEFSRVRDEIKRAFYSFFEQNILFKHIDICSDSDMICYCSRLTLGEVKSAMMSGCKTIDQVRSFTNKIITGNCYYSTPNSKCCHTRFNQVISLLNQSCSGQKTKYRLL